MRDSDELEPRAERLRARHAARKQTQPAPLCAVETSPVDTFAESIAVTKAERAWIREHLGPMHQRQLIHDVLRRIQAGKEATVYACSAGSAATQAVIAAKLYRAKSMRGERNVEHPLPRHRPWNVKIPIGVPTGEDPPGPSPGGKTSPRRPASRRSGGR